MLTQSRIKNEFSNTCLFLWAIFLIALAIIGVFVEKPYLILAAALSPFAVFFIVYATEHPNVPLLLVIVVYMFNVQPSYGIFTSNTVLIGLCIFSIVANKKFKILVDMKCIFLMIVYLLLIIFSYAYSHNSVSWYDVNLYVNNLVLLLLMFVFDDEDKIEVAFKFVVWCSFVLVLLGLYEVATRGMPTGGMRGYFRNHVMYALHIAWGIPLCFYFIKKHKGRIYLFVLMVLLLGEALALSRGVIMALVMSTLLILILRKWSDLSKKAKMAMVFLFAVLFISLPVSLINYKTFAHDLDIKNLNAVTSSRLILYKAAWNIFEEHPIVGIGWDRYEDIWSKHVDIIRPKYGTRGWLGNWKIPPHCSYLKILVELGLIGFAVFLFLNLSVINSLRKTMLTEIGIPLFFILLIYYFHGLVDNNTYGNERMFYFVVGFLFSIKYFNKCKKNEIKELERDVC